MDDDVLQIQCQFYTYKATIDGERIIFDVPESEILKGKLDGLRKKKNKYFTLILAEMPPTEKRPHAKKQPVKKEYKD